MLTTLIVACAVITLAAILIVHGAEDRDKATVIVASISGGFAILILWLLVAVFAVQVFLVLA